MARQVSKLVRRGFNDGLNAGLIAALVVVAGHDNEVLWREIVALQGRDELEAEARRAGYLRMAGFMRYRKTRRESDGAPR